MFLPSCIPTAYVIQYIDQTSMETFIANDRLFRLKLEYIFFPDQKYYNIFLTKNVNIFKNTLYDIITALNISTKHLDSYPVFLYFGLLFLITTVFSLLFLNYLGLYGVFILNLVSITLF
jgi:hypothetical protein